MYTWSDFFNGALIFTVLIVVLVGTLAVKLLMSPEARKAGGTLLGFFLKRRG